MIRIDLGDCFASLFGVVLAGSAYAALSIQPITWNVIGLDSNDPTTGRMRTLKLRCLTRTAPLLPGAQLHHHGNRRFRVGFYPTATRALCRAPHFPKSQLGTGPWR